MLPASIAVSRACPGPSALGHNRKHIFAPNDGWQFAQLEVAYVKLGYAADVPDLPDERGRQLDEHRPVKVTFTEVCAATRQASEDANLVFADQCLAAVLVPTEHGWFMQAGFGPCNHEAISSTRFPRRRVGSRALLKSNLGESLRECSQA